ncbi:MAG: bifunctional 2-C-methyl-D-erythritol 4-phosphate cytidylyltransferase/2-C-methyl-D-erythritol 2,4-cyclodiphosphate synthase [Sulfurovaceae bacterium]|nr:bifunctional 2-C-methyl-D-erythritol 4-phosphate cytidylyltransferase/2-C-methyl-D-erythritol 2,4-cyclodiphosphate synthase [Sulfurovaceae bacterium]
MQDITLILLGAGNSTRFNAPVKKQWIYIKDDPLWLFVAKQFEKYNFGDTIIVSSFDEIKYMKYFASYTYIEGGKTRQESLCNALSQVKTQFVLVSDVARCCIDHDMIGRILGAKGISDCIVPAIEIADTLYIDNKPADREKAKLIQTPQLSVTHLLKQALDSKQTFTDDSSAMASIGKNILFVEGSLSAHKLTTKNDLTKLPCLNHASDKTLIGFGLDIHPFEENKQMVLCGVKIDSLFGFKAHSDGDVAIHAIIDALLGAAGMGDIGELYPDTSSEYKNIDSALLLKDTVKKINSFGFKIEHIDITILAQIPKITPYKEKMRASLASLLGIQARHTNIKATTAEKLGFVGRNEGVTVHAVATLSYQNRKELL